MRRHVYGVRRRRRDACINARCRQPRLGHLRVVAGVNDVVRQAGMIRVPLEQRHQDGDRLLRVRQRGVPRRLRSQERQRVEGSCLLVLRILGVQLTHGVGIRGDALHVIGRRGIVVEDGQGGDEILFARGLRAQLLRHHHLLMALRQHRLLRALPDLVEVAQRDAPMRHRTRRIALGYVGELRLGVLVLERVHECDPAVELLLRGRRARNRKRNGTELLASIVMMHVRLVHVLRKQWNAAGQAKA